MSYNIIHTHALSALCVPLPGTAAYCVQLSSSKQAAAIAARTLITDYERQAARGLAVRRWAGPLLWQEQQSNN